MKLGYIAEDLGKFWWVSTSVTENKMAVNFISSTETANLNYILILFISHITIARYITVFSAPKNRANVCLFLIQFSSKFNQYV
jgi:hypothetical protein